MNLCMSKQDPSKFLLFSLSLSLSLSLSFSLSHALQVCITQVPEAYKILQPFLKDIADHC